MPLALLLSPRASVHLFGISLAPQPDWGDGAIKFVFSAVADVTVASSGADAAELLVRVDCAACGDEKALIRLELDIAISSNGQPVIFISEFERRSAKTL